MTLCARSLMVLNPYVVLEWFLVLLRGTAAMLLLILGCQALHDSAGPATRSGNRPELERRSYLMLSLASLLVVLNVVAWPLFYMMLQSLIPQWPGVMCVYGVAQIGKGSDGSARLLPDLVATLEWLKPAIVFLSGLWLVLYRINRETPTAPLATRVLVIQAALACFAIGDVAAEAAYLAIPKREESLSTGCCTTALAGRYDAAFQALQSMVGGSSKTGLTVAYVSVNLGLILLLGFRRYLGRLHAAGPAAPLLVGIFAVPLSAAFFVEIAAPTVLHLPYHHCLYDLIPRAPDMVLDIVLFVSGIFGIGWAFAASCLARCSEAQMPMRQEICRLLWISRHCLTASLMITLLDLYLA